MRYRMCGLYGLSIMSLAIMMGVIPRVEEPEVVVQSVSLHDHVGVCEPPTEAQLAELERENEVQRYRWSLMSLEELAGELIDQGCRSNEEIVGLVISVCPSPDQVCLPNWEPDWCYNSCTMCDGCEYTCKVSCDIACAEPSCYWDFIMCNKCNLCCEFWHFVCRGQLGCG